MEKGAVTLLNTEGGFEYQIMKDIALKVMESWSRTEGNVNKTEDIIRWIEEFNRTTYSDVCEANINDNTFWFYDDYNGEILNRKRSFFSIRGMRIFEDNVFFGEQPIIIQPEIGYLGIICREIDGVLNFLMQAKVEPGNVNCIQISPTIQATKSNFTRVHGGNLPTYFELFENLEKYDVIYDQVQSEQATRFYKKRNRNIIVAIDEDFMVYPNFCWMTLGQIKQLMKIDNLVNMDTRTVLSGLPLIGCVMSLEKRKTVKSHFKDMGLYYSLFESDPIEFLPKLYQKLNNYKMFKDVKIIGIPLNQLMDWEVTDYGISCKKASDFVVRFYNISISGREVKSWFQPLFKSTGIGTFGLITKINDSRREFLVRLRPEIGSFDKVEIGPAVQWKSVHCAEEDDDVERVFRKHLESNDGIMNDVILSEEGGRFYHEQNRNVILEVDASELTNVPADYVWTSYAALNYLVQTNNCLNIQLRNLLSIIDL